MEWIESTGSTVEEAVSGAIATLGIKLNELEYEIIAEGKKRLFGLGGVEARIRARVKPLVREKQRDKKQRNQRKPTAKRSTKSQSSRPEKKGKKVEKEMTVEQEDKEEKREFAAPLETQAQYAEDFLKGLVQYFDDACNISHTFEDDVINVSVDGKQVGLLIGSRGSTLFSVEELMRAVVQAKVGGFTARMYLDIGGYRSKRKEALVEFAKNLAEKVKETKRTQVLEPMVASDRKIVHDTIAEISGITTTSEGYDPKRRVVVAISEPEE